MDTKTKKWGWFKESTATDVEAALTVVVPNKASVNGETVPLKITIDVSTTGTKDRGWFCDLAGLGMIFGGLGVTFVGAAAGATAVGTAASFAGLAITVGGVLLLNYRGFHFY